MCFNFWYVNYCYEGDFFRIKKAIFLVPGLRDERLGVARREPLIGARTV